jgi:hypothetical protein
MSLPRRCGAFIFHANCMLTPLLRTLVLPVMPDPVRYIDLSYDNSQSHESAVRLVTTLFPDWATSQDTIEFIRFKDGITNTVWAISGDPLQSPPLTLYWL